LSVTAVAAAQSKSFYFTSALLQSIYKFNQANYEEAKGIIHPWVTDPDEKIQRTAQALDRGFEVFIENVKLVSSLMGRPDDEGTISYAIEGEKREDAAYLNMGSEIAKYIPEGLSKKERGLLLFRIDLLFGKELKQYRFHPTEATELTIGLSALESRLQGKNVEANPYFKILIDGEPPFRK